MKNKIIAKGKRFGANRYVECFIKNESVIIEVDYAFNEREQERFEKLLKTPPALGGTYYPPVNTLLAAYSVLLSTFFDENSDIEIKIEGDIGEIPILEEKDVIY